MAENIDYFLCRLKTTSAPELVYRARRQFIRIFFKKYRAKAHILLKIPEISNTGKRGISPPSFTAFKKNQNFKKAPGKVLFTLNEDTNKIKRYEEKNAHLYFSDVPVNDPEIDIRTVWEPARLQHITLLFFQRTPLFSISAKEEAWIKKDILNWIDKNPFLLGPHYISPMEAGLRIPVFLYCLKKLNSLSGYEKKKITTTIYTHAWWISNNLALYASCGNHTISEAIGLAFGGALFKNTKKGMKWLKTGIKLLSKELSHQLLDDGGPAEQSLNYHRMVLDLYWLIVDFLETNDLYDCTRWRQRLHAGERFWNAFRYDRKSVPSIGDSDDGFAVAPGISLRPPCLPKINKTDFKQNISHKTFPDAGYTLIRNAEKMFITFDHGPLGMPPLFNHGHADALSITLYKYRKPFFIDPGTCTYNGSPEKRAYFKGTKAHNTVCIDGMNQARQLTGFAWDKPYKVKWNILTSGPDTFLIRAVHDGYARLKNPVLHTREVKVSGRGTVIIQDTFSGKGAHDFELNFHLHPGVTISNKNKFLMLTHGNESIYIFNRNAQFSIISGQASPLLGWYSSGYGLLEKTTTLHIKTKGIPEDVVFTTFIGTDVDSLNSFLQEGPGHSMVRPSTPTERPLL